MMTKTLQVWSPMVSELNRFREDIDGLFEQRFGHPDGERKG